MKEHKCGLCGDSNFDNLIGRPFAGGPYPFYCKKCYAVIDDYNDSGIVRDEEII